jgi:hypothetical protein
MDEHSDPQRRRGRVHEAERALISAVRVALLPAFGLPLAVASVAASIAGGGLQLWFACPLAALALGANIACWLKVIKRWRKLPRPGDDDEGWRRWPGGDSPLEPTGGPGGIEFDWPGFELQFWAHVRALERQRELVPA